MKQMDKNKEEISEDLMKRMEEKFDTKYGGK